MCKPWLIPVLALPLVAVAGCDDGSCSGGRVLSVDSSGHEWCEAPFAATFDAKDDADQATREWEATSGRETEIADEATGFAIMEGGSAATERAWDKTAAAAYNADNPNCDPNYGATHDANGDAAACVPGDRDYDCPE